MNRFVIFGATSRIARGCARLWVERGAQVVLVARDPERLALAARELRALPGAADNVKTLVCDALDFSRLPGLPAAASALLGGVDGVLIAHGTLPDQRECERDFLRAREAIDVNATSAALVAEAFASHLERQRGGFVALIGSVAGDRGRASNYVYGAAKGFVERYAQGLRQRLHDTGVAVTLVKPGPTATPMTARIAVRGGKAADPDRVARDIIDGIERRCAVVYTPRKWWWIMGVVRAIPERVFVRLHL